jgi:hypothetical protein
MPRIYADFNGVDDQGRVVLNTVGSLSDLEKYASVLAERLQVTLYMPGEFEVSARLVFERGWLAIPDWETIVREE